MNLAETIISSLRRSGALILKNTWLLGWAALYTLSLPVLMLGGTGVPILIWVARGRHFEPMQLFSDPAGFLLAHLPLVLYSMAGCLVGFLLYLVILLFYHGALTGVAARGLPQGGGKAEKVGSWTFWEEGRSMFGTSVSSATLASLLPLPPLIVLLAVLTVAAFRLPTLLTGDLDFSVSGMVLLVVAMVLSAVATGITTFLGLIWYRFALCAARVERVPGAAAMGRAWRYVTSHAALVVAYVIAVIAFSLLSWGVTAPLSFGGKLLGSAFKPLGLALEIMAVPLGMVLTIFMDLWLKCALVALFVDNR